jgi:hypothetical protein
MARIAFYTFAIGRGPKRSEVVSGFEALVPAVFRKAEEADGFIARSPRADASSPFFGQDFGPWGVYAVPRFYRDGTGWGTATQATTLSVWRDPQAVRAFAYNGLHGRALAQREKWFRKPEWPTYAMWWIGDDHIPTWLEASDRLEHLHDHGPSSYVVDFKHQFDPRGLPVAEQTLAVCEPETQGSGRST